MTPGNILLRMKHDALFSAMVVLIGAISGEGANPASITLRGVNLHEAAAAASQGGRALEEDTCVSSGMTISGIQSSGGSGDVCCSAKCPACGGEGCSFPSIDDVDANDCCVSFIRSSGVYCDEISEAPCIIGSPPSTSSSSSTCNNGFPGIQSSDGSGNVCCSLECGRCGGADCADLPGGAENCCVGKIYDTGGLCTTKGSAPCIDYDDGDETSEDEEESPTPVTPAPTTLVTMTPSTAGTAVPSTPQPLSPMPAYVEGTSYIGCFEEIGSDPFNFRVEITDMTPALCYAECNSKDALYMGLMGSNECACGEDEDYVDSDKTEGDCDSVCEGDDSICGGGDSFGLYKLLPSRSDSDSVDDADFDRNGEIDGYAYKDCYDFDGEDPFDAVVGDENMTPEMCFEICATVSARYFGVYASRECGCGSDSDYIVFGGTPGTCDMSCAGDSAYSCGGTEAYDMYQLVDNNIGLDDSADGGLMECSNGVPGVESADGSVCCAAACGSCDGSRCVGTGGCCAHYIKAKYGYCSVEGEAPCVMD